MRKTLAVVCVVTSVALIAGGIAATTAGAQTTPDNPALPGLSMPGLSDLPALPQLPADPDTAAWPAAPAAPADPAAQDRPHGPARPGGATRPGGAAEPPDSAPPDVAARPGTPARTLDRDPVAAVAKPAEGQAGPAGDQQKPAVQRPPTLAASQQRVTADSVGTSPAAPVQQQVLDLVNTSRRRGGCDDLSLDRRLILAAQGHAVDMARRDYFAHESRNGDGAGDRVSDSGYRWKRYGENIARGADSAYEVVDGWMHSPVHRENIMDCQLEQMGIGLAFDSDQTPYWVQDFATPMP